MRFLCFGFLFFYFNPFICQELQKKDLLFEQEFSKSFNSKPKLDVKFDNRFSFIRDNTLKTVGVKVGLNFRRKFKVGLGINQMLVPIETTTTNISGEEVPVDLEYFYFSPYLEYVFHNSKRWEFSLSTQLGFGSANYRFTNFEGKKIQLQKSTVLSYEPAMLIDYKIVRWVGIGTGVGYRLVYYKESVIKEQFSSPEYVIKLKVYLGEIVRTITGKEFKID
tara:strand:- start:2841 stop:3503 length:663 start_codon:yes stop_codon:yes gene_type:complete